MGYVLDKIIVKQGCIIYIYKVMIVVCTLLEHSEEEEIQFYFCHPQTNPGILLSQNMTQRTSLGRKA